MNTLTSESKIEAKEIGLTIGRLKTKRTVKHWGDIIYEVIEDGVCVREYDCFDNADDAKSEYIQELIMRKMEADDRNSFVNDTDLNDTDLNDTDLNDIDLNELDLNDIDLNELDLKLSIPPVEFLQPLKPLKTTYQSIQKNVGGRVNRTNNLASDWKENAIKWELVQATTKSMGVSIQLDESNTFVKLCYRELIGIKLNYKGLLFKKIEYSLGGGSYVIIHLFDRINNKSVIAQYLNCGKLNDDMND